MIEIHDTRYRTRDLAPDPQECGQRPKNKGAFYWLPRLASSSAFFGTPTMFGTLTALRRRKA